MDKRVLFLAQGPLHWASSRYRAWWIAKYADWADCMLANDWRATPSDAYQIAVVPKWIGNKALDYLSHAKALGQIIIWDLCDPLWWLAPKEFAEQLPYMDHIVLSNQALADDLLGEYDVPVTVIPDRMDPEFHPTVKEHKERFTPVLLWYGQHWNRISLMSADLGLRRLTAEGVLFRLRILDDGPPGGVNFDGIAVEYHPWQLDTFHEELLAADVTLCPPYPGPWGRMKSDNKAVSAWWAGLPSIDLQDTQNLDMARGFLRSAQLRADGGQGRRQYAEQYCDVRQSVADWEKVLEEL